ncbi:TetR/AcrR family transcriptional regulator [Pseudonocardia halophobica]|uniref:TetR/AcrR family transcriptional regulator n=1 Tax=Pseudonocardia halophobica TaxID=29401 RepID=UPI003D90484B
MRRTPSGAAVLQPAKTASITTAVLEELAGSGYGRLAMEAVARRAGVGKSALYRRWPGKPEMVTAALSELSVPAVPTPDTGTLRGDLRVLVEAMHEWLTHPLIARILPDVSSEAVRNPDLADALRRTVGDPRRDMARPVFDRAAARGELAVDVDLALDLVGAPLYWRLSVRHVPLTPGYLDDLTDALLRALSRP